MSNAFCTRRARCCSLAGCANSGSGNEAGRSWDGLQQHNSSWPGAPEASLELLYTDKRLSTPAVTSCQVPSCSLDGGSNWKPLLAQAGGEGLLQSLRVLISSKTHCSLCISLSATIPPCRLAIRPFFLICYFRSRDLSTHPASSAVLRAAARCSSLRC